MAGRHPGHLPLSRPRTRLVATATGDARLHLHASARARTLVCLGHGAGGGVDAPDLSAVSARLASEGHAVALVEQPYRVAGRRAPVTVAARLDEAFRAAVAAARAETGEVPLVVGGRSAGARVACRTASSLGAAGAVALAFPLHPPGRPERSRLGELLGAGVAVLVVQGERDPFGRPGEFPPAPDTTLVAVAGDHTLTADLDAVAAAVSGWVGALGQAGRPA